MFLRYDIATRDERHRSTVPFTVPPAAGEADIELPDAAVTRPFGACRLTAALNGLEVETARQTTLAWAAVRAERDAKLLASDGLYLRAMDLGPAASITAWKTYRQALRDVPQIQTDPTAIVWPVSPTP